MSKDLLKLARSRSWSAKHNIVETVDPLGKGRDIILSNSLRIVVEVELLAFGCSKVETFSTAAELGAPEAAQVHVVAQIEQGEGNRVSICINCLQPAKTVLSRRVHEEYRS